MGVVSLEAIKPGMILSEAVRDRNGRVLLAEGALVTERHLRIFRMWGIAAASIEGEEAPVPAPGAPEIDPELIQKINKEVADLFCNNDPAHPLLRELIRLVLQDRLDQVKEGSVGCRA